MYRFLPLVPARALPTYRCTLCAPRAERGPATPRQKSTWVAVPAGSVAHCMRSSPRRRTVSASVGDARAPSCPR
eukprot:9480497-Pyramimonas_sp.AAC.1